MLLRALVLAAFVSIVAAVPASAAPSAVAYYRSHPRDADATTVVFRTSAALPAGVTGSIGERSASIYTVSPSLHCYLAQVYGGGVGDRIRVRIGREGRYLRTVLRVGRMTAGVARGGTLGCGADPASGAVLFGLYPLPEVEPSRWFFTANSGPYLKDLQWTGWGSSTATATGTYVSDCASCGPKQKYTVTVTIDHLVACAAWDAQAYGRLAFQREGGAQPGDPSDADRTLNLGTEYYC